MSSIKLDSFYVLIKGTNGVKAKFIGAPWMGLKKKAIWVPKSSVTNLQEPKQVWVPRWLGAARIVQRRKVLVFGSDCGDCEGFLTFPRQRAKRYSSKLLVAYVILILC